MSIMFTTVYDLNQRYFHIVLLGSSLFTGRTLNLIMFLNFRLSEALSMLLSLL